MTDQAQGGRKPCEPETVELPSVSGFIVFDLPEAQMSAGGTRLAPDPPFAAEVGT